MEQELGSWQPEGLPRRIEYSLAVLEELRLQADEGFQKIPHGGIEIGAVLLGERDGGTVRILEWRPIACDHARGPGFALSPSDRAALGESIGQCAAASELRGLCVVGWFHTHTRSGIFLSEEDVAIHEKFFPEPWQVALVLRPQKDAPPVAGFFCRDEDGKLETEASPLEFAVRPDVAQAMKPKRATAMPPGTVSASRIMAGRPEGSSRPPEGFTRSERPMFRTKSELRKPAAAVAAEASVEPEAALAPVPAPMRELSISAPGPSLVVSGFPPPLPPRAPRAGGRSFLWAAAALLAAAGGILALHFWRLDQASHTASLKIEESDRSLQITWDSNSPAVTAADRGMLRIVDGVTVRSVPLSLAAVQSGAVTYMREAEDVEVRLTLFRNNAASLQTFAHFVGGPLPGAAAAGADPGAPPPPIDRERLQLQADVSRLREALRDESERATRLREELALLEKTATAGGLKIPAPRR